MLLIIRIIVKYIRSGVGLDDSPVVAEFMIDYYGMYDIPELHEKDILAKIDEGIVGLSDE